MRETNQIMFFITFGPTVMDDIKDKKALNGRFKYEQHKKRPF